MAYEKTELTAPDGGKIVRVQFDDGTVRDFDPLVFAAVEPDGEDALKRHDQGEDATDDGMNRDRIERAGPGESRPGG